MMSESSPGATTPSTSEQLDPTSARRKSPNRLSPRPRPRRNRRSKSRSKSREPAQLNPDAPDEELYFSSSTEGPDSPGFSTTSSPIPMMVPPSPFHDHVGTFDEDEDMDEGSSILLPRFQVKFTDDVSKDGDEVHYRIKVRKILSAAEVGGRMDESPEPTVIDRIYEDFEELHRTLSSSGDLNGVIVPPLPVRWSSPDPAAAESRSRLQLGAANCLVRGDDLIRDGLRLERYLREMLIHPLFGREEKLAEFLERKHAPFRTKVKRGFSLSAMRATLESASAFTSVVSTTTTATSSKATSPISDPDETLFKEREWAALYGAQMKDTSERLQRLMNAHLRLSSQMRRLSTALNASAGGRDGVNGYYNGLNARFSSALEASDKTALERNISASEKTMGSYMSLWSGYMDSENAMLAKRATLVSTVESAAKSLAKKTGRGISTPSLRRLTEEKEANLENCNRRARSEVRRFHQKRLTEMRDSLVHYAEGQVSKNLALLNSF